MGKRSQARQKWRVARVQDDPRCDYCGKETREDVDESHPARATVDDVIPLSLGGANNPMNWALACQRCNHLKGDRHPRSRVPRHDIQRTKIMHRAYGIADAQAVERARRSEHAAICQRFGLSVPAS